MNSEILDMLVDLEAVNYELGFYDGQRQDADSIPVSTRQLKRLQLRAALKQALNGNKE